MTLLHNQDGRKDKICDKIIASLQLRLQRTPSFTLSLSSEFAVSDYQYYFCTVLIHIFYESL